MARKGATFLYYKLKLVVRHFFMIFYIYKPLSPVTVNVFAYECLDFETRCLNYWGADKSLARLWKEASYSNQDNTIPRILYTWVHA